jgi:MFS family permease
MKSVPAAAASVQTRVQSTAKTGRGWLMVFLVWLFCLSAAVIQFKVPPIMPVLMQELHLSVGSAGSLMSVLNITGVILAIPAGLILNRFGYRVMGLLAVGSLIVGSTLGGISTGPGLMLLSRFIEGIGAILMVVLGPALLGTWFSPEKRGLPFGIWATYIPVGSTIMMVTGAATTAKYGWRSLWWEGDVFAVLVGIVFLAAIRPGTAASAEHQEEPAAAIGSALKNRNLWLLSAAFACFAGSTIAVLTWAPTFLNTVRHIPLQVASPLVGLMMLINVVSCPGAGLLADKLGSRKGLFLTGMVGFGILCPLMAGLNQSAFLPVVVAIGLMTGLVPSPIIQEAVESAGDHRLAGMATAITFVGQNLGILIAPVAFGVVVQATGSWTVAFVAAGGFSVLGAVIGAFVRRRATVA